MIARRAGFEIASAWILRNADAAADEKYWTGRVQIMFPPCADIAARRMVGVAGSVAEHLWRGGWVEEYWPDESLSVSDWHLAGCKPDEPDDAFMDAIAEVGRLLAREGPEWQALVTESRRLIVESR